MTKPVAITLRYALVVAGGGVSGKCKMGLFGTAKVRRARVESGRHEKSRLGAVRGGVCCDLVAGVGFEPTTFRL